MAVGCEKVVMVAAPILSQIRWLLEEQYAMQKNDGSLGEQLKAQTGMCWIRYCWRAEHVGLP